MKILVFEPNWLGDVILTTPIFKTLKSHFKDCQLTCCITSRCRDVVAHNPYVDNIIEFNERVEDRSLIKKAIFVNKIKGYDLAILLHRSLTRTILCYLAGIKQRVGYGYKKRSWLLTSAWPSVDKDSVHKQDYYLDILKAINISICNNNCIVYVSKKEKEWANEIVTDVASSDRRLVAVNLLTNWVPKNWKLENFINMIELIKERFKNVDFILTSKNKVSFPEMSCVTNLTEQTSILQLAALYERCDLVISGDSGPLHLAGAVGAKYLGLYGPTAPRLTSVRSEACGIILSKNELCHTPCYEKKCAKNFICMDAITPIDAFNAALKLLSN
ncbi:MAG: glycosyltransferase family 9 protein [Candidatus Omnitrophica bacterium]|nr:glycosyltransferase family 9 protein [Candidatus Omnitrophota bacterium]